MGGARVGADRAQPMPKERAREQQVREDAERRRDGQRWHLTGHADCPSKRVTAEAKFHVS